MYGNKIAKILLFGKLVTASNESDTVEGEHPIVLAMALLE